jgi:hypothetical protein
VTPEADGFVISSDPYGTYGTEGALLVGSGVKESRSFLKFVVKGLGEAPKAAVVRVYAYDGGPDGGSAYLASNFYGASTAAWTDIGLKWATQPELYGLPLNTHGTVPGASWVEYDVTAAVSGNGTYSFALVATGTDALAFYSREKAPSAPELLITP